MIRDRSRRQPASDVSVESESPDSTWFLHSTLTERCCLPQSQQSGRMMAAMRDSIAAITHRRRTGSCQHDGQQDVSTPRPTDRWENSDQTPSGHTCCYLEDTKLTCVDRFMSRQLKLDSAIKYIGCNQKVPRRRFFATIFIIGISTEETFRKTLLKDIFDDTPNPFTSISGASQSFDVPFRELPYF